MTKVFVHGNPETDAVWSPLVDALRAEGLEDDVVTLSPPGFGAPVPDGWDPTPSRYVDWLIEEIRALDGPIDLVGHDWGAGHVFGLLAERAEMVRSWAADCVGLLHPGYVWHDLAQVWQTPEAGEQALADMAGAGAEARQTAYENLGLTAEVARSVAHAFDDEMARCILGLYRAAAQPAMAELGRELVETALPRGLAIGATDDPYVSADLGARMADRLDAAHLRLEGQSHWWMVVDPEPAAKGLLAFWAEL